MLSDACQTPTAMCDGNSADRTETALDAAVVAEKRLYTQNVQELDSKCSEYSGMCAPSATFDTQLQGVTTANIGIQQLIDISSWDLPTFAERITVDTDLQTLCDSVENLMWQTKSSWFKSPGPVRWPQLTDLVRLRRYTGLG